MAQKESQQVLNCTILCAKGRQRQAMQHTNAEGDFHHPRRFPVFLHISASTASASDPIGSGAGRSRFSEFDRRPESQRYAFLSCYRLKSCPETRQHPFQRSAAFQKKAGQIKQGNRCYPDSMRKCLRYRFSLFARLAVRINAAICHRRLMPARTIPQIAAVRYAACL